MSDPKTFTPPPHGLPSAPTGPALWAAARIWLKAYRVEVVLFLLSAAILASFSSQRFLRQSEAPHFVYQAKAWLEGRLDLDPDVLPERNPRPGTPLPTVIGRMPLFEDWACVRLVEGKKVRCEGPLREGDRFYSSFPAFPSVLMLPFVAIHGYQLNDTSFGVLVGALAVALFYALLRRLSLTGESERSPRENAALALLLGFGTVFFYCAIRGEVWFSAEVMGVALSSLYLRNAAGARRPVLAGLFFSMAALTRTPLLFAGVFFLLEALCPGPERLSQLAKLKEDFRPALSKLGWFAAGAAPLGLMGALYNYVRFGNPAEFGHNFIYFNRVNADIDRYGLFDLSYLSRNLEAAFLKLPSFSSTAPWLGYDPHGLTLLLTFPLLVFLLVPRERKKPTQLWWLGLAACLALPLLLTMAVPAQSRRAEWWLLVSLCALGAVAMALRLAERPRRLHFPLWLTVGACALPGFLYQNTGYMQFGFRFSLDYTPHLLVLFAIGGWSLKNRWVLGAAALGVAVSFWGAAAFRGYTEMIRNW